MHYYQLDDSLRYLYSRVWNLITYQFSNLIELNYVNIRAIEIKSQMVLHDIFLLKTMTM